MQIQTLFQAQLHRECLVRSGWTGLDGLGHDMWGNSPEGIWEKAPDPTTDIAAAFALWSELTVSKSIKFEPMMSGSGGCGGIECTVQIGNYYLGQSAIVSGYDHDLPFLICRAWYQWQTGIRVELEES